VVADSYPAADRIRVAVDHLNTPVLASFYATFPAAEAHCLLRRLEFHHPPQHGSWVNMAELAYSVLSLQYLDRRIDTKATLVREVTIGEAAPNADPTPVNWCFTTVLHGLRT
jgi:hypothetical protein